MRDATVVQVLQDLFYVLLHVLLYLWSLLRPLAIPAWPATTVGVSAHRSWLSITQQHEDEAHIIDWHWSRLGDQNALLVRVFPVHCQFPSARCTGDPGSGTLDLSWPDPKYRRRANCIGLLVNCPISGGYSDGCRGNVTPRYCWELRLPEVA